MPTKNFQATPAQIESVRSQLGLPAGNTGQFNPPSHPEIKLGYAYNGTDTLTLTIIEDAWYETAGEVWDAISQYLTPA